MQPACRVGRSARKSCTNAFFNRRGRENGGQKTEDRGRRMERSEKRKANSDLCAFLLCPIVPIVVKKLTAEA
jgi:hypothetical protein